MSLNINYDSMVTYQAGGEIETKQLGISTSFHINKGNFGVVYVNKFDPTKLVKKSNSDSLINEFTIGKRIDNPNFMKVYRLFEKVYVDQSGNTIISLYKLEIERIEGKSLEEVLNSEEISLDFYLKLTEAIYNGLIYLNDQHIAWEDLNSSNIMRSNNGEVKFIDYGLYIEQPNDAKRIECLLQNYQSLVWYINDNHDMSYDADDVNEHIADLLDKTIKELENGAPPQATLRSFLDYIKLYLVCL